MRGPLSEGSAGEILGVAPSGMPGVAPLAAAVCLRSRQLDNSQSSSSGAWDPSSGRVPPGGASNIAPLDVVSLRSGPLGSDRSFSGSVRDPSDGASDSDIGSATSDLGRSATAEVSLAVLKTPLAVPQFSVEAL